MFGCIFEHFRNFNMFPSNYCGLLNQFVKTIVNIFICIFFFLTKSEVHEYAHVFLLQMSKLISLYFYMFVHHFLTQSHIFVTD